MNVNDPFDWERPIVCAKELSSKTTIRDSQARSLVPKSRTRNRVNVTADSYIPAKKRNPKTDKKLAHSALQKFKKRVSLDFQ